MILSDDTFVQYGMKHYDNPHCKTVEEFDSDLKKIALIRKLLMKSSSNYRLTLNHIITLYNVFDPVACTKMLFFKIDKEFWCELKTYLVFLNFMVDAIPELNLHSSDIPLSKPIIDSLREV